MGRERGRRIATTEELKKLPIEERLKELGISTDPPSQEDLKERRKAVMAIKAWAEKMQIVESAEELLRDDSDEDEAAHG